MKPGDTIIGIDLGGTKLATGKVVGTDIIAPNHVVLPKGADKNTIINLIKSEIHKKFDIDVIGIGVGVPSVVDTKQGIVYDVQNIPSWEEVPLKQILESEFKVKVEINNDANCFVLGEMLYGKAKGYKNVAGVVVGTGLGVGVIAGGHLLEGSNCGAGEVGMIPYQESHYEYYCSGQYFINEFKMRGEEVYELAQKGNPQALMIFNYFGNHFGNALLAIIYAFDPEAIVIGGSIAKAKRFYEKVALEKVDGLAFRHTKSKVRILFSDMENAAIYGAAGLIALK